MYFFYIFHFIKKEFVYMCQCKLPVFMCEMYVFMEKFALFNKSFCYVLYYYCYILDHLTNENAKYGALWIE